MRRSGARMSPVQTVRFPQTTQSQPRGRSSRVDCTVSHRLDPCAEWRLRPVRATSVRPARPAKKRCRDAPTRRAVALGGCSTPTRQQRRSPTAKPTLRKAQSRSPTRRLAPDCGLLGEVRVGAARRVHSTRGHLHSRIVQPSGPAMGSVISGCLPMSRPCQHEKTISAEGSLRISRCACKEEHA
jgi:hypothetical protein